MTKIKTVIDNTGFGEWTKQLIMSEGQKPRPLDLRENAYTIVKHHPAWKARVGYDDFAKRVVLLRAPEIPGFPEGEWTLDHDLNFGLWCAQILRCWFKSPQTIAQGISMAATESRFHPVREWIEHLKWDETPRLDDWLEDCLGVRKTPYTIRVGRYFLLNLVARILEPGCICRSVPVLEGQQNRGKSESLRALAEPWFADAHLDLTNKDSFLIIQGVLLQEIPEMHAFSRADVSRVKEFISQREDHFRPPYGGRVIRPKRQVVFAGTTNDALYLRDWTGNTRYWPIKTEEVGEIDVGKLRAMREQLFAEAFALIGRPPANAQPGWVDRALAEKKERRHPTRDEEQELFAPQQEERAIEHPWLAPIARWLDSEDSSKPPGFAPLDSAKVTTREILARCLAIESAKLLDRHAQDVGRIMISLGYVRRREPTGRREWYYAPPPVPRPQNRDEVGTTIGTGKIST